MAAVFERITLRHSEIPLVAIETCETFRIRWREPLIMRWARSMLEVVQNPQMIPESRKARDLAREVFGDVDCKNLLVRHRQPRKIKSRVDP
jgi:hypothetical protein